ncbi:MAG: PASTA domain-containing protein [Muribaculaceae bacterium]|nr:PASTA domain-containing protein [Muribaculaceae bacterium]MDE6754632.1 PASTA domain-containing protein [Muribaculaceae bacterium]
MFEKKKTNLSGGEFFGKHPVLANIIIIILVAFLGIWIVYLSLQIFTKHGTTDVVPKVENMSYTQAINILHENGFRVDIRDSIYREDMKPGFVIEQFPKAGATVKPGRKIFLYINAVHAKEVVIDDDRHPAEDALKGYPPRLGMARLQELGFKNIRVVRVLGDSDRILRVIANGRVVKKTQKVPLNAKIVLEVQDGRLTALRDSLQNEEMRVYAEETPVEEPVEEPVTVEEEEETTTEDPEPVFVQ